MENSITIEGTIYGLTDDFDFLADYNGQEIKVDLIAAGLVDINSEDVHGKVKLIGQWFDDVFLADKFTYVS